MPPAKSAKKPASAKALMSSVGVDPVQAGSLISAIGAGPASAEVGAAAAGEPAARGLVLTRVFRRRATCRRPGSQVCITETPRGLSEYTYIPLAGILGHSIFDSQARNFLEKPMSAPRESRSSGRPNKKTLVWSSFAVKNRFRNLCAIKIYNKDMAFACQTLNRCCGCTRLFRSCIQTTVALLDPTSPLVLSFGMRLPCSRLHHSAVPSVPPPCSSCPLCARSVSPAGDNEHPELIPRSLPRGPLPRGECLIELGHPNQNSPV